MIQPPWFSGTWQNDFTYYHIHRVNKNSKKDLESEYIMYCINKTILPVQSSLWLLLNWFNLCQMSLPFGFFIQESLDYIISLIFCIKRETHWILIYFMLILPAYRSRYCRQIFVMCKTSYSIFCGKNLVYNNILCCLQLTFSVKTVVYQCSP